VSIHIKGEERWGFREAIGGRRSNDHSKCLKSIEYQHFYSNWFAYFELHVF